MKYAVTSKNLKDGSNGNDSKDLNVYTELGWELFMSRLNFIDAYQSGIFKDDVTVVTHRDRFFLYEGLFSVVDFMDFTKMGISQNDVVDFTVNMRNFLDNEQWAPRYKNFDRDIDIILNFKYKDMSRFDIDKPFVCLLARFRDHDSVRNVSEEYLNDVINFLKDNDINVFVFGKKSQEILKNINAVYVNIDEASYLMSKENCKFVFGTLSGGTCLGMFCHRRQMLILDPSRYSEHAGLKYHPLFMSECVNFTNVPIQFFCDKPSVQLLLDYI